MLKKIAKKTLIVAVIIVILIVLISLGLAFLIGYNPIRDPNFSFESLEDLQAVMTDEYYFFDFDDQIMQPSSYEATANTSHYRDLEQGDFEYIGYDISYIAVPVSQNGYTSYFFSVTAVSGENLDDVVDERKNFDSNITVNNITIDDIECLYIYGPNTPHTVYFMIGNIRYCFKMSRSKQETEFLSTCETGIKGRYQNI
jgi:hypothetical protein